MDLYGVTSQDNIDYFLDFSNATTDDSLDHHYHSHPHPPPPFFDSTTSTPNFTSSTLFTDHLSVPSDDVAELEWLSTFVDDSFTNYNEHDGTINFRSDTSFHGRARSKRTRGPATNRTWMTLPEPEPEPESEFSIPMTEKSKTNANKNETAAEASSEFTVDRSSSPSGVRRCAHCASEKTPQWRTGPTGPKTLCNACGVRYKSGRLVPEYRPAASPTFVLTEHSNSHRKVMELRRQKETLNNHQQHDYEVR